MQGAHRLEIVVKGKRRTALDSTPEIAGLEPFENGFLIEKHLCRSLEMPDHWIPNYLVALHFVDRPVRRFLFDSGREQVCVVRNGSCDVVAPHEVRRFHADGESRSLIVSIEPEALQTIVADSRPRDPLELLRLWHGEDPALRDLVLKLSSEMEAGVPNGSLFVDSLCTRLAETLVRGYSLGRARLDQHKGGIPGMKLRQVMEYIDCYLNTNLTTGDIARIAGLSKYHCGKAFKQTTGRPLHSYVMTRRVSRSRELLLKSDLPLAQVADAAGFASQSHFTTVFLRCTGMTPGSYRRLHKPLSLNIGMSHFA
jgi:AraC family transcriptional regulator